MEIGPLLRGRHGRPKGDADAAGQPDIQREGHADLAAQAEIDALYQNGRGEGGDNAGKGDSITQDEWTNERRRRDAEWFMEALEDAEEEGYQVVVLVGFKEEVPDAFRREIQRHGGFEFAGRDREQIIAAIIEDEDEER